MPGFSFFWLLAQGWQLSLLFLISPLGWALIILAFFTGRHAYRNKNWPATTWLHLAWPLLISMVCCAYAMRNTRIQGSPADDAAVNTLYWLMGLYLAGAVAVIAINRKSRAATTAVFSLGAFPVLGCGAVATMSITGAWL